MEEREKFYSLYTRDLHVFIITKKWMQVAKDRARWRAIAEAYVQQWTGVV
jgi:hypothetical protein